MITKVFVLVALFAQGNTVNHGVLVFEKAGDCLKEIKAQRELLEKKSSLVHIECSEQEINK